MSSQLPSNSCVDATSSPVGGVGSREQVSAQPEDLDVPGPTPGQPRKPRAGGGQRPWERPPAAALPLWEPLG